MKQIVLCLLWLLPAGSLWAQELTRGPFLQDVRTESILVVFEGHDLTEPTVAFGTDSKDEFEAPCACEADHCACLLAGLAPATWYAYQVTQAGDALADENVFRTAPAEPELFRFAVHGDNRSDHASHEMVVSNMAGEDYAFVCNTGDMVSNGAVEEQWDQFFAIEGEFLARTPIYPAVGNHEEDGGDAAIFERLFHTPSKASGSGHPTYYSFDYANAHFLVIDDFVEVNDWPDCMLAGKLYDNCLRDEQLEWVEADLLRAAGDSRIDHVFVFAHEGPYSSKVGRTGSGAIRELLPRFAESKVKVIFSGHDHYFEHGISSVGIHYVISGGGGAPLYETNPELVSQIEPHEKLISTSIHNYQVVTVNGPQIIVTTYNVDDQTVIDEFVLGEPPPDVPDVPEPPEGGEDLVAQPDADAPAVVEEAPESRGGGCTATPTAAPAAGWLLTFALLALCLRRRVRRAPRPLFDKE